MSKIDTLRLINLLRDRFKNINMQILGLVNDLEELKYKCINCGHSLFNHFHKLGPCEYSDITFGGEHNCECKQYEGILYE